MTNVKRSIIDRMRGAARIDVPTYEEVEADATATGQAAIVVALGAVSSAVGAVGHEPLKPFGALVSTLVGWLVWSGVTVVIGDKVFGRRATWGQILRTLAFARVPYVFLVLGIIPIWGYAVWVAIAVWTLIAAVYAIHLVLDLSTHRAIVVALIASLIEYALFWLLAVRG